MPSRSVLPSGLNPIASAALFCWEIALRSRSPSKNRTPDAHTHAQVLPSGANASIPVNSFAIDPMGVSATASTAGLCT